MDIFISPPFLSHLTTIYYFEYGWILISLSCCGSQLLFGKIWHKCNKYLTNLYGTKYLDGRVVTNRLKGGTIRNLSR